MDFKVILKNKYKILLQNKACLPYSSPTAKDKRSKIKDQRSKIKEGDRTLRTPQVQRRKSGGHPS